MCDPVTIAITRTALTIYQARESAKAEREAAIRQNQIAENARIQKENAENLRIRQVAIRKKDKAFDLNIESKEKQATARAAAENVGGAALDRVVNNYLRLEGKFTSQILANLEQEIANSNQNKSYLQWSKRVDNLTYRKLIQLVSLLLVPLSLAEII